MRAQRKIYHIGVTIVEDIPKLVGCMGVAMMLSSRINMCNCNY